jgi:hypothetical protein
MDIINNFVSAIGFSKVVEGDCFGESPTINESNKYNPLAYIEVYKRQLVMVVAGLLVLLLGIYMIYGDEAENMVTSTIDQAQVWLGSLLLGSYLTTATELKTTKSLEMPIIDDKLEIDESLLSPF